MQSATPNFSYCAGTGLSLNFFPAKRESGFSRFAVDSVGGETMQPGDGDSAKTSTHSALVHVGLALLENDSDRPANVPAIWQYGMARLQMVLPYGRHIRRGRQPAHNQQLQRMLQRVSKNDLDLSTYGQAIWIHTGYPGTKLKKKKLRKPTSYVCMYTVLNLV